MRQSRRFATLLLMLALLLALPLAARAFDDGTLCQAVQSGKHDWKRIEYAAPTCTKEGSATYRCGWCKKTASETIPRTAHRKVEQGALPTCTEDGYTVTVCADCGAQLTRKRTLPALVHQWVEEYRAPTCTVDGYRGSYCSRCHEKGQETAIPATGHTPRPERGRDATCTSDGYTASSVCAVCGATLEARKTIPALGHSWNGGTETVQPTCTAAGVRTYTCSRCGATRTEAIPASGHMWGRWEIEFPGTCVKQGMKVCHCRVCGEDKYQYAGYGDHDWGPWTVVTPAAPGIAGVEQRVCNNASDHVETRKIPALPEKEDGPAVAFTLSSAEDEGAGKRYEGAVVTFIATLVNNGSCPVYLPVPENGHDTAIPHGTTSLTGHAGSFAVLEPGEKMEYAYDQEVTAKQAEDGYAYNQSSTSIFWYDGDGRLQTGSATNTGHFIYLTYPEDARAELTLKWLYDSDSNKNPYDTDTFDPGDSVYALHFVTNTGSVPLDVWMHIYMPHDVDIHYSLGVLAPGEEFGRGSGAAIIGTVVDPGTETDEYLGTVTQTVWYSGHDVTTGEKLCETEPLISVWKVRRPADE